MQVKLAGHCVKIAGSVHLATMHYVTRNSFGGAVVPDDVKGTCVQDHITRQQCYTSLAEPSESGLQSSQILREIICCKRRITSTVCLAYGNNAMDTLDFA